MMLLSSTSSTRPTAMPPSSAIAAAPVHHLQTPQLAPACRRGAPCRLAQCSATTTDHPPAAPSGQRSAPAPAATGSSLTDLSARIVLERLYHWGAPSSDATEPSPQVVLAVSTEEKPSQREKNQDRSPDYFANVGDAIRTLREDIPLLFEREISYSIYREDIVFKDPRLTLEGIKNYKRLFWSLRASGRLFFSHIRVEVKRIWQPMDGVIKMRWCVVGVPRVPWDAEGFFDGISTYKLDHNGKVYEHNVDNVLLRDPPALAATSPLLSRINLVPNMQQPCPGACTASTDVRPDEQLPQASAPTAPHHAVASRRPRRPAAAPPTPAPAASSPQHSVPSALAAAHGGTPAAAELWAEAVRDVSLSFQPAPLDTPAAPPATRQHHHTAAAAALAAAPQRRARRDAPPRPASSAAQASMATAGDSPAPAKTFSKVAAQHASKPAAPVAAAAPVAVAPQPQARQGGGSGGGGGGSWSQQLAWERLQEALVAGADVAAGSLHAPGHSAASALEPSPSH